MVETVKGHVTLYDPNSQEELPLLLTDVGTLGYIERLANPYAAKVGGGDQALSDLTDLSVYGQTDWSGGRGQEIWEDDTRYYDAEGIETRIDGQITLGPLSRATDTIAAPFYRPDSVTGYPIGKLSDEKQVWAQSFTTVGAVTCTHLNLLLRCTAPMGSETFSVRIETDSPGSPSGTQVTNADETVSASSLDTSFRSYRVNWSGGNVSLGVTTKYWIVLEWDMNYSDTAHIEWAGDAVGTTYSGVCKFKVRAWTVQGSEIEGTDTIENQGSYTTLTTNDFWFHVNGPGLGDAITVQPAVYGGALYMAAGDTVYKWSAGAWASSDQQAAETVTSMEVWGGMVWVARGANNVRTLTGAVWADDVGPIQAQLFRQYNGYLYYTKASDQDELYYTADGTTWTGPIYIGPEDWGVNGIAGFRTEIACVNDVGCWFIAGDLGYQVLDWHSLEDSDNGQKVIAWASRNELFIPVSHGLFRFSGASVIPCGPDQDAGLPKDRAGKVAAMCGTVNWLFAAVDAGASGYSSIMAYDGQGWHEIVRAAYAGDRIRTVFYETVSSPPRLWYGEDDAPRYIEMPDFTDNPYGYSGVDVIESGTLDLSFWGSELLPVVKDFYRVVLSTENASAGQTIAVYYEVDTSGIWTLLGTVNTAHTIHTLSFPGSSFTAKTVGSGSTTTTIEVDETIGIEPGDFVRINDEIRQVSSITDIDTFVLALPLSTAPSSGDTVYGSAPAGTQIRLRLQFATTDTTESPKMTALALYCQANTADRWQYSLSVRVEDGLTDLTGSAYPYDAKSLITELRAWAKRQTAVTLYDLWGGTHTVKVANAVLASLMRHEAENSTGWKYAGVMQLGIIEVEAE